MENMRQVILQLEEKLQRSDIRKSAKELDKLISDNFTEIGSSGQIYTKKDVLVNLPISPEIKFIVSDFKINILTPEIVQSLFRTEKINNQTGEITISLRSSIWKNENSIWRIIFHQGTLLQK